MTGIHERYFISSAQWTETMTQNRLAQLRHEACVFFAISEAELDEKIEASRGIENVWNWLGWAQWEWRYGWLPDVIDKAAALGIMNALDFGCGVGEAGLHLAAQLDIPVTYCDFPSASREFLSWRIGSRLDCNCSRPISPTELFATDKQYDLTLCLEVLEHIRNAPEILSQLLARTKTALCISGVLGRPAEIDSDPLHVYRGSLLPLLEGMGWGILHGGGKPWWFVRAEMARERGWKMIQANGEEA